MPIVMMIAFTGSSIYFIYFFGSNLCQYSLYKLLATTLFFHPGNSFFEYKSALLLWSCIVFYSTFLLNLMIWLNFCMAIDLVFMIKYPFKSKSSGFFYLISFGTSFVVAVLNCIAYSHSFLDRDFYLSIWFMLSIVMYLVTGISSIIFARRKLK